MATPLTRPVARELHARTHRFTGIIATMMPGDLLTFRVKGKQRTYTIALHQCYQLAIYYKLVEDYREAMERYELRRKAGYRAKKPKAPNLSAFSAHLRHILGSASPLMTR